MVNSKLKKIFKIKQFYLKGQSKCGVYLSRYPDIALKYTENKKWPDHIMVKMVIFKVIIQINKQFKQNHYNYIILRFVMANKH